MCLRRLNCPIIPHCNHHSILYRMLKQQTNKRTTKKKRSGPSKEVALANLAKAHEKRRLSREILETSDIDTHDNYNKYKSLSSDKKRAYTLETSEYMLYKLGSQVRRILESSGKDTLLANSYGFKSLTDTYQNLSRLVYPLGLNKTEGSHLSHLFGSIQAELGKMLTPHVTIHLGTMSSHDKSGVLSSENGSQVTEGRGHPLGRMASGSDSRHVKSHTHDTPPGTVHQETPDTTVVDAEYIEEKE